MPRRVAFSQTSQEIFAEDIPKKHRKVPPKGEYAGCFLDVGCCFPIKVSNTFFFYERGWRGICVDANPAMEPLFAEARPEDKFVCAAIGEEEAVQPFFLFSNPQLNTFDPARKLKLPNSFQEEISIQVQRLETILSTHLGEGRPIDFLSLDIEGLELAALKSLNLDRYRPSLITLEMICSIAKVAQQAPTKYLVERGYELISHTGHDASFIDEAPSS